MYWKCLLVNFLLVLPNTRIITSEAREYIQLEESRDGQYGRSSETEVDIVEKIINQLSQDELSKDDIAQAAVLDKKDQTQVFQNAGSCDNGIQTQDLNAGQPSPINNQPDSKSQSDLALALAETQFNGQGSASVHAAPGQAAPLQQQQQQPAEDSRGSRIISVDDKQFIIIVAVAVSTSFVGLMMAGVCYYKFRKSAKAASDVEYPVYGVTGPVKERIPSPGDRKLAQSAQMYHYQHQKQQMIAMEKANGDMKHDASDDDSEEDNIEGDYTVYECPGLAPTGEMEVRNPLFRADDTPVTPGEDITGQPHGQEPPPERGNQ